MRPKNGVIRRMKISGFKRRNVKTTAIVIKPGHVPDFAPFGDKIRTKNLKKLIFEQKL